MLVAVEAKPHVMSWLHSSRLEGIEGTEIKVIDTDKRDFGYPENDYCRVFFPQVAIDDVHSITDLRRLAEEQPMPRDCDVCPSERFGWLVIKGYASDDRVFVASFYSEEQYCYVLANKHHERGEFGFSASSFRLKAATFSSALASPQTALF